MRIDRFNGNTLRRYHLPTGAVLVVYTNKKIPPRVLAGWCNHVAIPICRVKALDHLREFQHRRRMLRKALSPSLRSSKNS